MKRNLVTLLGVIAIIAGIVVVRTAFEQTIQTEAEKKAAEDAEKKLKEAESLPDDLKLKEDPNKKVAEAATKDDAPIQTVALDKLEEIAWAASAPDVFRVKFDTTAGPIVIQSHRDWSPLGHERFYELCKSGFFDNSGFFRVIRGFMVQFGLAADPKMTAQYSYTPLKDEPVIKSNQRGKVTFAKSGRPNSRTSQLFINYGDNSRLDSDDFTPFGEVIAGMENAEKINDEYGEKPDQGLISSKGTAYLKEKFPKLDFINKVTMVEEKH